MNQETSITEQTPAERFYKSHLKRVSEYQKSNPEKCREKCKKYNERLREQHPEKYAEVLQQKREYYINVRKPKIEAAREAAIREKTAMEATSVRKNEAIDKVKLFTAMVDAMEYAKNETAKLEYIQMQQSQVSNITMEFCPY